MGGRGAGERQGALARPERTRRGREAGGGEVWGGGGQGPPPPQESALAWCYSAFRGCVVSIGVFSPWMEAAARRPLYKAVRSLAQTTLMVCYGRGSRDPGKCPPPPQFKASLLLSLSFESYLSWIEAVARRLLYKAILI